MSSGLMFDPFADYNVFLRSLAPFMPNCFFSENCWKKRSHQQRLLYCTLSVLYYCLKKKRYASTTSNILPTFSVQYDYGHVEKKILVMCVHLVGTHEQFCCFTHHDDDLACLFLSSIKIRFLAISPRGHVVRRRANSAQSCTL